MKSRFFMTLAMIVAMVTTSKQIYSQAAFALPANTDLNTAADYKRHEPTIIKASKWLEQTPLDQQKEERSKVNAFILNWSSGPSVNIDLNMSLMKLFRDNSNLLGIYLGSYCRYCIENKVKSSKEAAKAAFTSVNTVYTKGVDIKKSNGLDYLSKQIADGKLDQYVSEMMK